MCTISTFSCEQVKPLNFRPPCCWSGLGTLSMHRSLVVPLSGAAQCDIAIAIYRISLSFAGNELGNAPTAWKQLRWRRRLDLICTSGQRRTNTLVGRTYARWPLRASGVLDPLARTGPPRKKKPPGQRSLSRPVLEPSNAISICCNKTHHYHVYITRMCLILERSKVTGLHVLQTNNAITCFYILCKHWMHFTCLLQFVQWISLCLGQAICDTGRYESVLCKDASALAACYSHWWNDTG